eukprot:Em0005g1519a
MASARFESSEEVSEPSDHQEDSEVDLATIQRELELLNSNGDVINSLESKLMQAKAQNRKDYAAFKERLDAMKKKDSSTIAKCEPLVKAKKKMVEPGTDKANSQHSAAKELIQVAECQLSTSQNVDGTTMDQAWQETLNHATERVVETALDKSHAEQEHKMAADEFAKAHLEYNELWKKLQKFYEKAKPYYVECSSCNEILRKHRKNIEDLERQIKEAKASYSGALKALDTLSCSIHEKRRATITSSFEETDQSDYHGSNDRLSFMEFEAGMLNSVPSSSSLLSDEGSAHSAPHDLPPYAPHDPPPYAPHDPPPYAPHDPPPYAPHNEPPSSQGKMSKSSSTSTVMDRVVGGNAVLKSSSNTSIHTCHHPISPPNPSGHHDDNGSPGIPGCHDNSHHRIPPGHRGVSPPLLSNPLVIVSHDQSGVSSGHKNASDYSCTTPCQNPASDGPALSSDQSGDASHRHDVILGTTHDVILDTHDVILDTHDVILDTHDVILDTHDVI